MYDLIDNKLKNYYIKCHKYIFIVGLFLSLILSILSIFYTVLLAILVIFVIITLVFFITWNKNKKKYGQKLSYNTDVITIYNYKNLKINEFKIEYLKSGYMRIAFDKYPKFNFINCLIIYINFEPYENMEYSSYWKEKNLLIIQNPLLIKELKKILSF